MTTKQDEVKAIADQLGLTMATKFVPWSQSRSKGEKQPSLNWLVTISKGGREVLTTDYMAGCGHCPAYKASVKELGNQNSVMRAEAIRFECENGNAARVMSSIDQILAGKPILPDFADVLYSLVSDADVIDAGGFEDWAENYGYDTDSRKVEGIYRDCLETALKLRGAIGEDGLQQLREALQDY